MPISFISILPEVGSYNLSNNFTIDVLPAPFSPAIKICSPFFIVNETLLRAKVSVLGYEKETLLNVIV